MRNLGWVYQSADHDTPGEFKGVLARIGCRILHFLSSMCCCSLWIWAQGLRKRYTRCTKRSKKNYRGRFVKVESLSLCQLDSEASQAEYSRARGEKTLNLVLYVDRVEMFKSNLH
jgi:hypothetical protein